MLNRTHAVRRWGIVLCAALALWAHAASPVFAADPKAVAAKDKDYTKSYGVVILLIGLGVLVVCRPGRRSDQAKRPESDAL